MSAVPDDRPSKREMRRGFFGSVTILLIGLGVLISLTSREASGWTAIAFGYVPAAICIALGTLLLIQLARTYRER